MPTLKSKGEGKTARKLLPTQALRLGAEETKSADPGVFLTAMVGRKRKRL